MVLILESRSHLDLGDLPNLLAAELGVMTVRLERAIRSLDGVARVHVNRWGDGSAHLHVWFLARPYGRLQLRGTFLSLWDDILPPIPESQWRENLALVAAWLAEFGGRPLAEPPHIDWKAPAVDEPSAGGGRVDESSGPVRRRPRRAGERGQPATARAEHRGPDESVDRPDDAMDVDEHTDRDRLDATAGDSRLDRRHRRQIPTRRRRRAGRRSASPRRLGRRHATPARRTATTMCRTAAPAPRRPDPSGTGRRSATKQYERAAGNARNR